MYKSVLRNQGTHLVLKRECKLKVKQTIRFILNNYRDISMVSLTVQFVAHNPTNSFTTSAMILHIYEKLVGNWTHCH